MRFLPPQLRFISILTIVVVSAGCTTVKSPVFAPDNQAIRGYDPVAYFTAGEPRKGQDQFQFNDGSTKWLFESAKNRDAFKQNPSQYKPQYGGYCAYAMSKGFVVSTDPNAWTVENDQLYLNYSLGVRETWLKDVDGYIEKADMHWQNKTHQ